MSQVRTHEINTLLTPEGDLFPDPQPGDTVRHCLAPGSFGMVVEKTEEKSVSVLWSKYPDVLDSFVRPVGRNTYIQLPKDMFPIQPMPPGALPFYLDHMNKEEEK